jgi:hypothetical protein
MLLPMLGACFVAMLVPALLRGPPIYESLRANIPVVSKKRAEERQKGAVLRRNEPCPLWVKLRPSLRLEQAS